MNSSHGRPRNEMRDFAIQQARVLAGITLNSFRSVLDSATNNIPYHSNPQYDFSQWRNSTYAPTSTTASNPTAVFDPIPERRSDASTLSRYYIYL